MSKTRTCALLSASVISALFAVPAWASQNDQAAQERNSSETKASQPDVDTSDIIVTATKMSSDIQTMPGSLSVLTGRQLENIGAASFADYLALVPGVIFNDAVPGWSFATIRGVASTTQADQGQGTTGYYFDDIPLTDPTYSIGTPDVDAFDANNITVLRGPQASLFGAAALGGAINYKPNPVDLNAVSARLQGSGSSTKNGAESWAARGMANIPIVKDTLGARFVIYSRTDGGYYENVGTGQNNSNETRTQGGRAIILWQPSDKLRIGYTYLYQKQTTDDIGYEQPAIGELKKNTPFAESFSGETEVHSLRIDLETGIGTITSLTSYKKKTQELHLNATPYFAGLAANVPYYVTNQYATSKGPAAELRLASPAGGIDVSGLGKFDYVVGGFFADNDNPLDSPFTGPNVVKGVNAQWGGILGDPEVGTKYASGDVIYRGKSTFDAKEYALFGEANWHLSPKLKLTFGGRYYHDQVNQISETSGFINYLRLRQGVSTISGTRTWEGFLPKGAVTWTPDEKVTVYALVSKGFRLGGVNLVRPSASGQSVPQSYDPDSIVNYETGFKYKSVDGSFAFEGTYFHIDWSNIQLRSYLTGVGFYQGNGGRAKNDGFEATVYWRPNRRFTIGGGVTHLDGRLADPYDPGNNQPIVPKGRSLPGASKWQANAVATYALDTLPIPVKFTLANQYVSKAPGIFNQVGVEQGGWNKLDLRVALGLNKLANDAELTFFVNNLTNSRGVVTSQFPAPIQLQRYLLRPITFGTTLDLKL